ncbi:hypothetical protein D9M72_564800 [compost metagenome]
MPGMTWSVTSMPKLAPAASACAWSPSAASVTSNPPARRQAPIMRRSEGESSTTRMLGDNMGASGLQDSIDPPGWTARAAQPATDGPAQGCAANAGSLPDRLSAALQKNFSRQAPPCFRNASAKPAASNGNDSR